MDQTNCTPAHGHKFCQILTELGVRFDSKLCFSDHVNEKISKAYVQCPIGVIKRNFMYMDKNTFTLLYKAMVRPHLEYANAVWCPYKKGDIEIIEKVKKSHKANHIFKAYIL